MGQDFSYALFVQSSCQVKGVDSQVLSQLNAPKAEIRSSCCENRADHKSILADFYCIACDGHGLRPLEDV